MALRDQYQGGVAVRLMPAMGGEAICARNGWRLRCGFRSFLGVPFRDLAFVGITIGRFLGLENETSRRAVGEQSARVVSHSPLCCADTTPPVENLALGFDLAHIWGDRADERNLEL